MSSIQEILNANLKRLRKQKGLSQEQFAEFCGISVSYLAHIEAGDNLPSLDLVQKIVNACQVQPFELFLEQDDFENYVVRDSLRVHKLRKYLQNALEIIE